MNNITDCTQIFKHIVKHQYIENNYYDIYL